MQDFVKLRERGFVYVDKTARIHQLITGSGETFFLSRPRRFGKSLLCSTLAAVFEGRRELFEETAGRPALAINSLDWAWKKHPVIRLDLNAEAYSNGGLDALHSILHSELQKEAERHGIELGSGNAISRFKYLIRKACEKTGEKAVVLIDEYDKPLLDTLTDTALHSAILNELKGFYGVLKSSDEYLRFLFLTGVTKFSQVSVFSNFEFKLDKTAEEVLAQIDTKEYLLPWSGCGKKLFKVGVNFDSEKRNIGDWKYETVNLGTSTWTTGADMPGVAV